MKYNLKKLKALVKMYLDEAQLSDDEGQIIILCSILDDVEGFEKELREIESDAPRSKVTMLDDNLAVYIKIKVILGE